MCLKRIELRVITLAMDEIDYFLREWGGWGVLGNLLPITHFERRTQGTVHNGAKITSHTITRSLDRSCARMVGQVSQVTTRDSIRLGLESIDYRPLRPKYCNPRHWR